MTGRAEHGTRTPGRLDPLLTGITTEAISAAGGFAGGVYLRSGTPGLLRLAVLSGLPGPLFRPWSRVHVDRRFPVADAFRLGVQVVLADATETMRRYPQFAAGLPFQFGSLYVPVVGRSTTYGVLTLLRPSVSDTTEVLPDRDRMAQLADDLGEALWNLEEEGGPEVVWDGEPLCVRPLASHPPAGRMGRFTWDPASGVVTADSRLHALLGVPPGVLTDTPQGLADAVAPADSPQILSALRETSVGRPPPLPLPVHAADGGLRLLELWTPEDLPVPSRPHTVRGLVLDPDIGSAGDGAADLLPEGVFCLDRLGLIVYANERAAHLLDRPRTRLLGRPLGEEVPWLERSAYEDHLREALLSSEPVHFHVVRPLDDGARHGEAPVPGPAGGDWMAISVYPGPDILTCTIVSANRVADPVPTAAHEGSAATGVPLSERPAAGVTSMAPLYRPIVLAIALTEAVTARQVSAVVMQELLPAFGGGRLAIYLLQERHLYLAWETGFPQGFLAPFEGVALDARIPGAETLTTGRPLFFESMQQLAAAYPGIPLDATEGSRAFLPLIASGRPVGSCILGFDRPRGFSTEERTVLTALAGLIAHAMEKAQRYDSEAALARGLQQALLPRRLSAHPQLETVGRYLPGTQGMDVGGDWYDVVESGHGLALVIGDVQGHGVQAAATMGQLRSAVRAFALGDRSPDEVMSGTNHLLIDLDPGLFASCCYIRLDPLTGLARVARAGHPPPILRYPDGRTHVLDIPGGIVLGVDPQAHYPVTELRLDPGAVLALYTDGLVERPGVDIDEGITALRVALARAGAPAARPGGRSLAGIADRLTAKARHVADRPDDIALLLATRRVTPRSHG
ncbi:serine phosphatase RsbU (regulator of sigma subunit)/PAS domain-containing protein [Streptomyces sp. V3I8]|uniref:SpoIIE family protein phosphatase n=1 Tax=Streptomyces sp. V3I8 TaxID=3042279 RepID=UPI0027833670|nr:SpoIIE family protein phosphatase [Streptomyces sp. V3I8]MDQ1034197.1 serine phosphatase RsbU (regulator of sigma subunit)/PAS domain-containing protein [Streptomyces sp. V3I8]